MKKDEALIASQNWEAFDAAYDARHARYVEESEKHNAFYLGDQWSEDDRQRLESQGRPVLTINEILTTVNAVLGEHSETRVDIRFKARNTLHEETATVLTHVVDQILDANRYGERETAVFADGVIQDVGYFDVRMNFERNALGEVELRSLDPNDVVLDPEAKEYDPETWTEVFTSRWHTLDEVEAVYDKKTRQKLEGLVMAGGAYGQNSARFEGGQRFGDGQALVPSGPDALAKLRGLRIIERQWKKLSKRQIFVDMETGDMKPVPETWEKERVAQVAQEYGLGVTTQVVPRVRWTVSCDHVLLHDEWSPYDFFTIVPFFPFFRRGMFSGLVRQLISPQEQLNKIESQQLHVVNTTANSGWSIEEGSLANMTPEELEQRGAETGIVLVHRKGRTAPQKIQPNQVPTGLDRLGSKALQFIHEIAGTEALMGRPPKSEVSGVAMERSQSRAVVKLQPIFRNLEISRRLVAERILKLVQEFYSETRIMRVTDWRDATEPDIEVAINQPTPAGEILNNVTIGSYDVIIGSAPARDGALDTEFAEAIQLMEVGVPIPPEVIIRASHLQRKHEVAELVMQMQGRGEPTDEEAQLLQMQQQIEMQSLQLGLQEAEARVMKIQSEAQLMAARAQNMEMDTELQPAGKMAEIQLELEKLKAQAEMAMADLENKLQLARLHTESRNAQNVMGTMAKRLDTDRKIEGQKEVALISARVAANRQQARGSK